MISPDEFQVIADLIKEEKELTTEQAKTLLSSIYELDANLVILQNALELTVMNAQEVIPAVAEKVLAMAGRNDTKAKKKAANFAGQVTAQFTTATHLYLSGAYEQAQEMLQKLNNGESLDEPLEKEEGTNNE